MDFYSAIKPMYYVSKATGLAQFYYCKTDLKKCFNGKVSRANDIIPSGISWTLFVLLIHVLGLVSVMIWNFLYDYKHYTVNVTVTDTFSILLLYGSSFSCLITVGIVHRKDVIQILKTQSLLDTVLLQDHRELSYRKINTFLIVELSLCVVILFLAYCYHVSSWASGISFIPFVSKDLAHFTGTVILIQYIDIVLLLCNRFKKLNEKLSLQCDDIKYNLRSHNLQSIFSRCHRIACTGDSAASLPCERECKVNYYKSFCNSSLKRFGNHRSARELVREARVMHSELVDVCELVSSSYGLPLLVLFAYYFTSFISSSYYVLQKIVSLEKTGETDIGTFRGVISSSFWALVFMMKVVATTAVCTEASAAARSTGRIVQKLFLQAVSQDVVSELKLFSLQLLGNKTELFTAFEFFEINLSFLYSFLGATAMYMIVLIQLK